MKCCVECFKDAYIRDTIQRYGTIGDCDFCAAKGVTVFDITEAPNPIGDIIIEVVQIYSVSDNIFAKPLKAVLRDDWDIFNGGSELIQALTKKLCSSVISENAEIFNQNVLLPQTKDMEFLGEFGVVRGHSWEEFSHSIKYKNRFHNNTFNPDAFASFISVVAKTYPIDFRGFRARISHDKNGHSMVEMGVPPVNKRSAGRINPEGIAVLYLSSDSKTVLKEVRAAAFDYITIGEFRLLRELKIVNLSGISRTSPFLYASELEKYAANRKVFQEIAFEIAKPLRRSDSQIEYLPTQYIAEFIKSQGYDGVEYASTLHPGGANVAIFDETAFECIKVNTVEVSEILYKTSPDL